MSNVSDGSLAQNLVKKIEFEWRKYFMYLKLCSNLYVATRAKEIYYKNLIYDQLIADISDGKLSSTDMREYLLASDLIDTFYARAQDSVNISKGRIESRSWDMLKSAVKF